MPMLANPGSKMLYGAATGFEKALADSDCERLLAIYAEAIIDTWDAYKISAANLPFLAYAMGVNLWEDDLWDETFKRYWVNQQWHLKALRGTPEGTKQFVRAVRGNVKRLIRPPAITFPAPKLTDTEREAYVARFPQLRIYPYFPREELPYLCFVGKHFQPNGTRGYPLNGGFFGPLRKIFTTHQDKGGRWTRTATLWDRGVETQLTGRTVVNVDAGPNDVRTYDEVMLPGHFGSMYFTAQPSKYLLPPSALKTTHGVFLGRLGRTEERLIRVPRDGQISFNLGKAQYQTIKPSTDMINVYPKHVYQTHPRRKTEAYMARRKDFLHGKFLPPSNAYLYLYEVWYLFDQTRVPDYRKASVFLGHTRLGIHKFTAEAKVEMFGHWPRFFLQTSGYLRGFLRKPNTDAVDRLRRSVVASKALRDTILLDTRILRPVQVADVILADGSHFVGQLIKD